MIDQGGRQSWQAATTAYGRVRMEQGTRAECPFRFQGQYEDTETGLYYNRFRYYDPQEGTYISQDPIGLASAESNLYAYVQNPNSVLDPFGLSRLNIAKSWNQFQTKTAGWFGSRHEAATGWKVYKQSSSSVEELAIGRLADTAAEARGMRRLNTNGWTILCISVKVTQAFRSKLTHPAAG